jgi:PIN domain nuclease of toxin-antitoxin system
VTDTHALIWYLNDDPRLSPAAAQYFDECETDGGTIRVPSICVVELQYLAEKNRVEWKAVESLFASLASAETVLEVAALDLGVARRIRQVPREHVPDMPDRIIAATALHLGLPLLSRDRRIQIAGLDTIW